jgi:murein DD-endopeptidase MepM/ murein hydrolase activator NlpD
VKLHLQLADWLRKHAAADRNSITVTIAPAQASRTFQIELPRWSLRVLGVSLIAGFVLVVAGGILYGRLIRDALLLRETRLENVQLRARADKIKDLESQIAQIDHVRRQLYSIAGVPDSMSIDSDTRTPDDPMTIIAEPAALGNGIADSPMAAGAHLRDLPFRGPVSRGYSAGRKLSPEHSGIDIAGPEGAAVSAAGDGVVVFAGWDPTFGNLLVLRHGDGWETKYGHSASLFVTVGDSVRAGQTISLLGSTGKSSAPHLHFEIVHNGAPIDPGDCFPALRSKATER